ncbi:MAG: TIGR00730 family Rossman fold protein [Rhodospirillaceae bacterium]|nr:TIGR00730 family Rossman fold protein [Rhodospirillaceae bacterium]
MKINHLCVFCGASQGNNSVFRASAVSLGSELAKNKIQLIYGGGSSGLMGFLANSVLASGGEVTGVIPQHLKDRELGHHGLTKLEVVDNMHQRKERMFELADGIVVLPGGVGTLEEVLEIITWKQLGLHKKPIIFLNIMGYWENFYNLIKATVEQGFANEQTQNLYISIDAPECLIPTLENL